MLTFQEQIVLITGAARGLGRAYAIDFAKRGAHVIVNDIDAKEAQVVVDFICQTCNPVGKIIADGNSAEQVLQIVANCVKHFGQVPHVLILNAGFTRDSALHNMTLQQFDAIYQVHLQSVFTMIHACWPEFRKRQYGRIVLTSSAAGLYGNYGQSNYGACKMALVGLAKNLQQEGQKFDICTNVIAPIAFTRMSEKVYPPSTQQLLDPTGIVPLVVALSSKECKVNGQVYECAGSKFVAWTRIQRSQVLQSENSGSNLTEDQILQWMNALPKGDKMTYFDKAEDAVLKAIQSVSLKSKL